MTAPAGGATVQIEGLARLARTMKRAGLDLADMKDANKRAGEIVASAAAKRAPKVSGKLAASIRPTRMQARARVVAGRAAVPYAGAIHWGWPARRIAAQPFISEAAQETEPQWTAAYLHDLQAAVDKVKGA